MFPIDLLERLKREAFERACQYNRAVYWTDVMREELEARFPRKADSVTVQIVGPSSKGEVK